MLLQVGGVMITDPLVPLATLVVAPTTRGVNGDPDSADTFIVIDHSPTMVDSAPPFDSHFRPTPNGSSQVAFALNWWR